MLGTGSSGVQVIPEIAAQAAQLNVFQRTPAFSVPSWNGPLDPAVERDIKEHYDERRRLARETGGGNPWHERPVSVFDATPEERQAEFEARYRVGGFFLHSAYNDLFTDADANELISEFVRGKIRSRVADPGSPSSSARTSTRWRPSGCASTWTTTRRSTARTCGW